MPFQNRTKKSLQLLPQHLGPPLDNPFTMQAVELYNPRSSNLHLVPFSSGYSISDDMNPLNYQLTADDFIVLTQSDGQITYSLDPSTTTSLFWALHRLARHITRAASHGLHNDPTIPFASKGYIPQIYFDRINMQRPDILTIQNYNFLNPLYGYTTRENLTAWYRDFQMIGRLAVQWIQTAQRQTLQLGPGTGWNWEVRQGPRLEYPERRLISNGSEEDNSVDFLSDTTSEGSSGELGSWSDDEPSTASNGKRIVLHPIMSAYAARYPDFDPFAGQALIDNGYIGDGNKREQNVTSIDYYNTLFTRATE